MLQQYATAAGPANIVGIDLHTIWDVHADKTYVIDHHYSLETSKHLHQKGGTGLICVRTLDGRGSIRLKGQQTLTIKKNTILLLQWDEISGYACMEDKWNFWWFEFTVTGPLKIPLNRVVSIYPFHKEAELFRRACQLLRRKEDTLRCLASSCVVEMLYRWLASQVESLSTSPYHSTIETIIDKMNAHMNQLWTVKQMADDAHMSERNFRKVFREVTGQSPKQFYHQLRLSFARQLLNQQNTISQTAEKLGFSSPYHLSREFKAFFGISPQSLKYWG